MLSGMLNNLQGLQGLQANQVKMDEFQTQRMNRSKATELLRSYQETQDPGLYYRDGHICRKSGKVEGR
jgi:hypothetical protein